MTTAPANPLRVREFDHGALTRLPEYAALVRAMDALVHAVNREKIELSHDGWLDAVRNVAAVLGFTDGCPGCPEGKAAPYWVSIDGEALTGRYVCPDCSHSWKCNWLIDAPLWLGWAE